MSLTPQALRLLSREIITLRSEPPEGVRIVVDEEDLSAMEGWVQGPAGTPYEGGYWRIRFSFGPEYPNMPPKCTMITRIFHPNVSKAGEICVDTLKKSWKKEYGVRHVLVTIKCLLIYPNPESALDEEAGKQLLADYEGYCKYARLMTSIHATPKLPPPEFRDSSTSSQLSDRSPVLPTSVSAPKSNPATVPSGVAAAVSSIRPSPLGATAKQETSPSVSESTVVDAPLKPAGLSGGGGAVKTAPGALGGKTGQAKTAKRGLKRL